VNSRSAAVMTGLMLVVVMGACAPLATPTPAIPEPSATLKPTATLQPTATEAMPEPTMTPELTMTPVQPAAVLTPTPAAKTYSDHVLGVVLQYPAGWDPQLGYERKYAGLDGFFQLSAIAGAGASIDEVADNDAHHKLRPYGSEPTIEKLQVEGREARLILPSADQPGAMKGQAGLIVDLPQPIEISGQKYDYLILWADKEHIRAMAQTLKLQQPVAQATPKSSPAATSTVVPAATCAVQAGQHPCSSNVQLVDESGVLHGSGERGTNPMVLTLQGLPKILAQRRDFPFIVVSPQCPPEQWWWSRTHVLSALLEKIESRYSVDSKRIYVTGLSMGGYGTWALAYRYPQRFAAIVPIAGGYYDGTDTLPKDICVLKDVPTWAFHGAMDDVVLPSESERVVSVLKACGSAVRFTLYPEAGHVESWELAYDDPELYEWLLQHALE